MRLEKFKVGLARVYQVISYGLLLVVTIGAVSAFISSLPKLGSSLDEMNYSLVYDKEYYLANNPDIILDTYENDEEIDDPAFEHFKNEGMKEGRIASEKFDVVYYRELYPDLETAFGDDWELYYEHYIECGNFEGRIATVSDNVRGGYALGLTSEIKEQNVVLKITQNVDFLEANRIYIFQLNAYEDELAEENLVKVINKDTMQVKLDIRNITDKYVLAIVGEGGYEIVSNTAFICNPEVLSVNASSEVESNSKKGIQFSEDDELDEFYSNLRLSNVQCDFIFEDLLSVSSSSGQVISYEYNGENYYFNKSEVQKLDEKFAKWAEENVIVSARILCEYDKSFSDLYYENAIASNNTHYYAINTSKEYGAETLAAFVAFFTERYNGTDEENRLLSNWIVGSNVNDNSSTNYMGEVELGDYVEEYARTFRIVYNTAKVQNSSVNVYVPISNRWGYKSDTLSYGGREFLNAFNDQIVIEGALDWGLSCEALSYPLNDPLVDNDDTITLGETGKATYETDVASNIVDTNLITMKNIDVLTRYIHRTPFLNKDGEVRSVIVSGIGYTSDSNIYGNCEALQAASIVYSYYKAEMNEDIDMYIYGYLNDEEDSKYSFGINSKHAYDVFRIMDSKDAIDSLSYICDIIDIEDWNEVISYFDASKFNDFDALPVEESIEEIDTDVEDVEIEESGNEETDAEDDTDNEDLVGPFDISTVQIQSIEDCKYTGKECRPQVIVTLGEVTLVEDVDYDLVYVNNIEVGVAKVMIIGLNDYYGYITSQFEIVEEK